MRRVRVLPDIVVDQIAAGEVVERPASALKELIENAIDASATQIDVQLRAGGTTLVRVVDNGVGMDRADATLCIERHATSKIEAAQDLVGVNTFGFRGEALPSIASVSRFELRTRQADQEAGTLVSVDHGRLTDVRDVGCAVGTDISVRSIFSGVPARRRFLRSRQVELSHCVEAVKRALFWRMDVAIKVVEESRVVLHAPVQTTLLERATSFLGDAGQRLMPVDAEVRGIRVHGLASPLNVHRSSSQGGIYLYVNGRFVSDPVVRRGLTEAYRGLLPKGRYPVAVLALEVDPLDVDVNVHPAKTEVRFRNKAAVVAAVSEAVRAALRAPIQRRTTPDLTVPAAPEASELPLPGAGGFAAHPDDDPRVEALERPTPTPEETEAAWAKLLAQAPVPAAVEDPSPSPVAARLQPSAPVASAPALAPEGPVFRMLIGGRVMVGEHEGQLVMVDGVAEARRWLAALLADAPVPAAPLLAPLLRQVSRRVMEAVETAQDTFEPLGVELAAMGPAEVALLAVPQVFPHVDNEAIFEALLEALERQSDLRAALIEAAAQTLEITEHVHVLFARAEAPQVVGVAELLTWMRDAPTRG